LEWLDDFQKRKVTVRPADSIRARVQTVIKYGYDNRVVATQQNIIKVMQVLPEQDNTQTSMFET
jgi:hypothetical protein